MKNENLRSLAAMAVMAWSLGGVLAQESKKTDNVEATRASDASHLSCHTPNGPACASNRKGGAVRTRSVGDTSANRPECGLAKA